MPTLTCRDLKPAWSHSSSERDRDGADIGDLAIDHCADRQAHLTHPPNQRRVAELDLDGANGVRADVQSDCRGGHLAAPSIGSSILGGGSRPLRRRADHRFPHTWGTTGQALPTMADTNGVPHRVTDPTRRKPTDTGFSLIEQIIAMTVIVGALLGLLSTLGATAQGLTTARQRTIAVSLAKQVIERLQGDSYKNVAMDLSSLAGEPLVVGVAPNQTFEGENVVPGGTKPYRTYPVSVGTTFSIRTFVTAVAVGRLRIPSHHGDRRLAVGGAATHGPVLVAGVSAQLRLVPGQQRCCRGDRRADLDQRTSRR